MATTGCKQARKARAVLRQRKGPSNSPSSTAWTSVCQCNSLAAEREPWTGAARGRWQKSAEGGALRRSWQTKCEQQQDTPHASTLCRARSCPPHLFSQLSPRQRAIQLTVEQSVSHDHASAVPSLPAPPPAEGGHIYSVPAEASILTINVEVANLPMMGHWSPSHSLISMTGAEQQTSYIHPSWTVIAPAATSKRRHTWL